MTIEAKVEKKLGTFLLNAQIKEKGIICITGKNGSGKTTFLRSIAGFLNIDEGYVKINNKDVTKFPPEKREIALVTSESYIPGIKVRSHLIWGAKIRKIKYDEEDLEEYKDLLGGISLDEKVDKLSLGQKERVSILTAILSKPKVILIDEAFSNINNKEDFIESIIELIRKNSIELIFTTQDINDSHFANSHLRMEEGKLLKIF
ncbi:ATP-binding cassette domain-containing protein [Acidianus sp. HS-5]|uniref:ATP-binding cassette domain-containing protein n=1 Tax=Acidianus sp. HS-5 TaxID=2886040 RepID=UPI001F016490|nr:ATP-binding cassette domain-containing protein [Acidianus sp. HS-5]BDC19783.1 sugar ABC transporter ATP-binding protein [Acidianus sp. HS-5]